MKTIANESSSRRFLGWTISTACLLVLGFTPSSRAASETNLSLQVQALADGIQLQLHSPTGQLYRIESSVDLDRWETAAVSYNGTGTIDFFPEVEKDAEYFRASVAAPEALIGSAGTTPVVSDTAAFQTVSVNGGKHQFGGVELDFAATDLEGDLRVAVVQAPVAAPETSPVWNARVQRPNHDFSIVTRGDGSLRGGRLTIHYDPASIPEGWEPRILHSSKGARALPGLGNFVTDWPPLYDQQTITAEEYVRMTNATHNALEQGVLLDESHASKPENFRSLICAHASTPGKIEAPILAGDAPGLQEFIELVLTRTNQSRHLTDELGRTIACLTFLQSPSHGRENYADRVEAALRRSMRHARKMGIPEPRLPLSITVVDEIAAYGLGFYEQLYASTSGNRMVLRSDLAHLFPIQTPGLLEFTIAHEYFHVLQCFGMSLATYNNPRNDWAIEGSADWFGHAVYPLYPRAWSPPVAGLENSTSYEGALFWSYLHQTFGHRIVTEFLDLLREAALGPNRFKDLSLRVAFGLRLEIQSATEALDRVLKRRDSSLSEAFGDFATSYLYMRDVNYPNVPEDQDNLWTRFPPADELAWREENLTGTTTNYPIIHDNFASAELSAVAVRFREPIDRGDFFLHIENPRTVLSSMDPSFCRELGEPKIRVTLYGERAGEEPLLLSTDLIGTNGMEISVGNVGYGGDFESIVAIIANTGWRTRRDCPGSSVGLESNIGTLRYRLRAYLHHLKAKRVPMATFVHPPSGGKRWCISKSRDEDGDGNRCFGTFAAAISNNEVKENHELVVDPGVYEEQIVISKPLKIRPLVPGTVTIKFPGQVVTFAARDASFCNFIIIGGGNTVAAVASIPEAHSSVVAGNIILSRGYGVYLRESHGVAITHNWIAAPQGGIYVADGTGPVVDDNIIAPPFIRPELSEPDFSGDRIEAPSNFDGAIGAAIDLRRCSGGSIVNNESMTWTWLATSTLDGGLHCVASSGLTVRSNLFRTDNGSAFYAGGGGNFALLGNRLAGYIGIDIRDASDVRVEGNTTRGFEDAVHLIRSGGVTLATNHFIPDGGSWALYATDVLALTSQGDLFDGMDGAGASFNRCGNLFFNGSTFRGRDTACELWDTPNVTVLDSNFEQAASKDVASTPGQGACLVARRSDQINIRSTRFKTLGQGIDIEDGAHFPWQDLRFVGRGLSGIYSDRTMLSLKNVVIEGEFEYPFAAREGSIQIENLRFTLRGETAASLPTTKVIQGVLAFQPVHDEIAIPVTALTPWWWEFRFYEDSGRLELEYNLETPTLPVPPLFDELAFLSLYKPAETIPGRGNPTSGVVKTATTTVDESVMSELGIAKFGLTAIGPSAEYP